MPVRSASWMDEVGTSAPRRPSVSGPLLPYTLGSTLHNTDHRSYSFSAGETQQSPRTLGYQTSNPAHSAIAEEAIVDEVDSLGQASYITSARRSSTPLISRNPWSPLQGNQQRGFFDMEYSTSRPLPARAVAMGLPSFTDIPRVRGPSIPHENFAESKSRESLSKLNSKDWSSYASFAQLGLLQETQYVASRNRPIARGGLTRAETWDPRIGNRGSREWETLSLGKTYYAVIEFKSHRADVYYFNERNAVNIIIGSFVIVDADRGHDLGKTMFVTELLSEALDVKRNLNRENYNALLKFSRMGRPPGWNSEQSFNSYHEFNTNCSFAGGFATVEGQSSVTKAVKRLALDHEIQQLEYKAEREEAAKRLCILAVQRHGLHLHEMEILEAEFQYDWGKLTFYFLSPQYLHFNPLVTELFKLFKTRIWMSALNPASCVAPSPQQIMRAGPLTWSEQPGKSVHQYSGGPGTPQLFGHLVNDVEHGSSTVSSLDLQI